MTDIQTLVLPNIIFGAPQEMYVRLLNDKVWGPIQSKVLTFERGGMASFDTYFNSVSVQVWKKNTTVNDISLRIEGAGRFWIRIGLHQECCNSRWLQEQEVVISASEPAVIPINSWGKLINGMIYFSVTSLEEGAISGGAFFTKTAPKKVVNLGIVITHFNRKHYVLPAMARIQKELLQDLRFKDNINLIVVDNSRNISPEESCGATVIANENLGGSGGFMRGLLYLKDHGEFTHCLFMDDDASCEIESIRRAYSIMSFATDKKAAISGSLLRENHTHVIHEKTAHFSKGQYFQNKHGLDMINVNDLLRANNDELAPRSRDCAEYGGWWFFLFEIASAEYCVFPFFVRGDDIQFSIINKFRIISDNGISCWGEDFHHKESPLTRYLALRATILLSLFHEKLSVRTAIIHICLPWWLRTILSYNYASAKACTLALEHITNGPDFFLNNMDLSNIRKTISQFTPPEKMETLNNIDRNLLEHVSVNESKFRRVIRLFALNGFLLPSFLIKNKIAYQEKHFVGTLRDIYRYKRVLYVREDIGTGYIAEYNRTRFIIETYAFVKVCIRFALKYNKLRQQYKNNLVNMASESFWRDIYASYISTQGKKND